MGKIQGSVVTALGSAAVAGRMVSNERDQALAAGDRAETQNKELEIQNQEAVNEQKDIYKEAAGRYEDKLEAEQNMIAAHELAGEAKSASDREYLADQMYKAFSERTKAGKDIEKAQQALKTLDDKIAARNFMIQNNMKAINRANR